MDFLFFFRNLNFNGDVVPPFLKMHKSFCGYFFADPSCVADDADAVLGHE